jgi:outer membrane protein TolC
MVDKSKSSKYPQINFNSYVGKNYGEDRGINGWDDETMVQVGLSLKYTIYDFGKRDISIQKAQLSKLEAKLGKEQSVLDIKKMLVEAVQKINQSYAEYLGNSKQYELSKKSESIESVRYQNGVSTLNDLLLAKSKTELASAKVIQGKYNYKKSIYYLDYILERGIK